MMSFCKKRRGPTLPQSSRKRAGESLLAHKASAAEVRNTPK